MSTTPALASSRVGVTAATLVTSALLGRLPQAMSALALVRVALDTGSNYGTAGLLASFYVLTSTLSGPLLSRVVDRTGSLRGVLLASALMSAAAFGGVAAAAKPAVGLAVVLAGLAGLVAPPLEPVLRSLWPLLMQPGRQLQRALAADTAVQEVLFILGPLLTAVAIVLVGAQGAVLAMALFALIGTVLFCLHRATARRTDRSTAPGVRPHGSALRVAAIRVLVLVLVLAGLPIGVLTISTTQVGVITGNGAVAGFGLAANATGALVGAVLVARLRRPLPAARSLPILTACLAVLYLPTALLHLPVVLWLIAAGISGLALPPLLTQVFTVVAETAPGEVATEANAWVVTAFNVGIGVGTLLAAQEAGAAASAGVSMSVVLASLACGGGAVVALVLRSRASSTAIGR